MSLSWRRKHLRIGLAPERVMVSGAKVIDVPAGAGGWDAALQCLGEPLAAAKGGEASVVIADQLARYALLPWNDTLKTEEQWLALARHRFAGLHGARATEWDVRVTATAPKGPRLGCAVDLALIEGLKAACAAHEIRLVSVQPFLVAAYNRIRRMVGSRSCWVVVEEHGRITLVLIKDGAWLAIRGRRCDERWRLVLPEILEREAAFLGLSEPCTRVIVCAQDGFDTQMHGEWRTDALSYRELALAAPE
ncbi:MAG TPA: hypothetical protein VFC18_04500 [Burkholderiales bacterium]|nr:hypothetical protein [Burkholderiales bacterium]